MFIVDDLRKTNLVHGFASWCEYWQRLYKVLYIIRPYLYRCIVHFMEWLVCLKHCWGRKAYQARFIYVDESAICLLGRCWKPLSAYVRLMWRFSYVQGGWMSRGIQGVQGKSRACWPVRCISYVRLRVVGRASKLARGKKITCQLLDLWGTRRRISSNNTVKELVYRRTPNINDKWRPKLKISILLWPSWVNHSYKQHTCYTKLSQPTSIWPWPWSHNTSTCINQRQWMDLRHRHFVLLIVILAWLLEHGLTFLSRSSTTWPRRVTPELRLCCVWNLRVKILMADLYRSSTKTNDQSTEMDLVCSMPIFNRLCANSLTRSSQELDWRQSWPLQGRTSF